MLAQRPSSAIRYVAYDADKRELYVGFRGGGDYTYFGVPEAEYRLLAQAPSRGAYLNAEIKGRFPCARRGPARRRIWLDEERWPRREKSA